MDGIAVPVNMVARSGYLKVRCMCVFVRVCVCMRVGICVYVSRLNVLAWVWVAPSIVKKAAGYLYVCLYIYVLISSYRHVGCTRAPSRKGALYKKPSR